ncbi:MAG: histidine phosphatase family protein [Candidatus Dormibacteraeota bacterium]|nr:histidine phosphatase family protein [Candidatus Dormibacteraeota bacterium]
MFAIIRHADAGDREAWTGDDRLRPLSRRGHRQVRRLVAELSGWPLERVLSSPYRRCVQTVEPLAVPRGLAVEPAAALAEGADLDDTLTLLRRLGGWTAALSTHGDVVLNLCQYLVGLRLISQADVAGQKGSVWVLEESGGDLTAAHYLPIR